jgi:thymidylate synthase
MVKLKIINFMYKNIEPFGYHVLADSIGEAWISLVKCLLEKGENSRDEKRGRIALQNLRIKINKFEIPDTILDKYADKEKIESVIYLTFKGEEMYDFDIVPSFSAGPKSYYARLKEGKMMEYVIDRLSKIPESKKAVISFINWKDYELVMADHYDDYLPCICNIQFRLIKENKGWKMTTVLYARSMDGFQKTAGNLLATAMLSQKIAKQVSENLKVPVMCGAIDCFVTDVHIYEECINNAKEIIKKYDQDN